MFSFESSPPSSAAESAEALLARHVMHVIYKHSPTCSLSQAAAQELAVYRATPDALPVTVVDVLRDRALSTAIEDVTGVRHESPQVLLVRGGAVEWHASHRRVTAKALADAQHLREGAIN